MRLFQIIAVIILITSSTALFAQKYHSNFKKCEVDTIHLFNPIGFIGVPGNKEITPNDSLTTLHDYSLDSIIRINESIFFNETRRLSKEESEYFIDLIYRLSILEDRIFASNSISQQIIDYIERIDGRYIGVMLYSGFENKIQSEAIIASAMMLSATLLVSGGTFWATYVPKSSYYKLHLAVFDKNEKCILYYNESEIGRSFSKEKVIPKSLHRCIKGLKPCSSSSS